MLYTEQQVRDNLRNEQGRRVFYLGPGDSLTSGARDFLTRERAEILPARQARKDRYALLSGGFVEEKPEHLTHLNGDYLVRKTHPRIRFRGKLDSFQSILLLAMVHVPDFQKELSEILDFSHSLLRDEVLEKPIEDRKLCGRSEAEIRKVSHFPQDTYGIPHFMPAPGEDPQILWLNLLRAAAREAELSAAEAFCDRDGNPTRVDLLRALNRISSMLYILMIKRKAETG